MSVIEQKAQQIAMDLEGQKVAFPLLLIGIIAGVIGIIGLIWFLRHRANHALAVMRNPSWYYRYRMRRVFREKYPQADPHACVDAFIRSARTWSVADVQSMFAEARR